MNVQLTEKTATPYRLEDQIGYILRLAGQRHANIFQALVPANLTRTQFSTLVKLLHLGSCSQNELGRQTAMDVATIKGVVDRLRERNFVEVNPDPNDKRRSLLTPTQAAKDLMNELHESGKKITEATLAPLSATERKRLLELLAKLS